MNRKTITAALSVLGAFRLPSRSRGKSTPRLQTPSRLPPLLAGAALLAVVLVVAAHPVSAQTPSDNADLSSLSILGTGVPGFSASATSYTVSVDTPEGSAAIEARAADAYAMVAYGVADADGHQVVLNEGDNTVTAEDGVAKKSYTVTVTALDAADSDATTALATVDPTPTSAPATHYRGSIREAGDVDWTRVKLESGQMYRFALKGSYRSSSRTLDVPMIIGLYDDNVNYIHGTRVVGTVGYGDRADARLHYMAEADGDYYVAVRGIEDQTGTYALRVPKVPDDTQPDNVSTPGVIAVGGSKQGIIDYRGDMDWYQVSSLEIGAQYVIEVRARSDWPLSWPVVALYDSSGYRVPVNYLTPSRSRAAFTPASGGAYYVAARSGWNRSGQYTLSLNKDLTVRFGAAAYSATEGAAVTVTVTLSLDPERQVTIPLSKTNQGGASDDDYSGVPDNVVFESGETEQSFTVTATDDTDLDPDESEQLAFGTLPAGVTAGSPATATVSITDNDLSVMVTAAGYGELNVSWSLRMAPTRPPTRRTTCATS